MHVPFSSIRHFNNGFYDTVCTFRSQIKVLNEHIFVKRVQNYSYNKYKAELSDDDLLVHVDFTESYRNDKQNEIKRAYFENQRFLLFTSCCYFKGVTSVIRNKSVVALTKNSDHNKITWVVWKRWLMLWRLNAVNHSPMSFCGVMVWTLHSSTISRTNVLE